MTDYLISIIRGPYILLVRVWVSEICERYEGGKKVKSGRKIGDIGGFHLCLDLPEKFHEHFYRFSSFHNFWCFMVWGFAKKRLQHESQMVDLRPVGEWNDSLEVERERLTKEIKKLL
jgi:hypothetical protein